MNKMRICPYCFGGEAEEGVCPLCEYPGGTEEQPDVLPVGTKLGDRYFVGKVLGRGGFGITYIGFDTRLELIVAIKEFYPDGFAYREKAEGPSGPSNTVHSLPGNKRAIFEKSMERFKQEAKSLAKFSREPGVVNVTDYFSEYDTYYIVMEFINGDKLDTVLKSWGRVSEESVLEMFLPIIKTLGKMHKAGIIHRDISPNNIMLEKEGGKPRLIDFGSASQFDMNDGNSTMATQTPGFTPEEVMRGERGRQGAWTDVYSICASMYTALEAKKLPDPMSRLLEGEHFEMSSDISEATRKALENGLIVAHNKRTQSMEQLLRELPSAENRVQNTENRVQNTEPVKIQKTEPVKAPKAEPVIAPNKELVKVAASAPTPAPVREPIELSPGEWFVYSGERITADDISIYSPSGPVSNRSPIKKPEPPAPPAPPAPISKTPPPPAPVTVLSDEKILFDDMIFTKNYDKKTLSVKSFGRKKSDVTIPEKVSGMDVVSILGGAFNSLGLKSVVIPGSVRDIRYGAFSGCPNVVIHAPKGSAADKYAFDNKIPFVSITPPAPISAPPPPPAPVSKPPAPPSNPPLPPAKSYTYLPPYFEGLKLYEKVNYLPDGSFTAASHMNGEKYAGFVIDYKPNEYLIFSVTNRDCRSMYDGKQTILQIDLLQSVYGRIYFGESVNRHWSDEGCLFDKFNEPLFQWDSFHWDSHLGKSVANGTNYYFDGKNIFILECKDNKIVNQIKLQKKNGAFSLDKNGLLGFKTTDKYQGFLLGGKKHYFGYETDSSGNYLGQYIDGKKTGFGIYCHKSGDVFIGLYSDDCEKYGLYYSKIVDRCFFMKNEDNKTLTPIDEFKGLKIDFRKFFN